MRASTFVRTAAALCAAAGLFTGCSGTPASSQLTPQASHTNAHRSLNRSWMSPEAKNDKLLYVSMDWNDTVNVYSYPKLALVGTMSGLWVPMGMCSDTTGNVWITNYELNGYLPGYLNEYAHGGTNVIATLQDGEQSPSDCSIDPTTGNLAIANRIPAAGTYTSGNLGIYKNAKGNPTTYVDPDIFFYYWCAYDDKGNLFTNGFSQGSQVVFAELPKGSKKMITLKLDEPMSWPVGIKWDGQYLIAGNGDDDNPTVYRFKINGNKATTVSSLTLNAASSIGQFTLFGKKLIVPSVFNGTVGLYKYPAGGVPTRSVSPSNEPVGTVVSVGK